MGDALEIFSSFLFIFHFVALNDRHSTILSFMEHKLHVNQQKVVKHVDLMKAHHISPISGGSADVQGGEGSV